MWKDPFRAPEATIGKREAWRCGSAPSGRLHWEEAGASGGPGLQNPGVLGSRLGVQAADWPVRPFSSSSFSPCPRTSERTEGSPLQRPWAWAPASFPVTLMGDRRTWWGCPQDPSPPQAHVCGTRRPDASPQPRAPDPRVQMGLCLLALAIPSPLCQGRAVGTWGDRKEAVCFQEEQRGEDCAGGCEPHAEPRACPATLGH